MKMLNHSDWSGWRYVHCASQPALINRFRPRTNVIIGSVCYGRTGKQMRERWHNQLDPNIRKDPWTPEEDQRLLMAYQVYIIEAPVVLQDVEC
jgi:hypothetical protein